MKNECWWWWIDVVDEGWLKVVQLWFYWFLLRVAEDGVVGLGVVKEDERWSARGGFGDRMAADVDWSSSVALVVFIGGWMFSPWLLLHA
ncbi:hypothetical protein Drorol1_Dr00015077 [Drosera rotundifolia]